MLQAASLVGQDGKGKDGLVGYLMSLAVKERAVYARLLKITRSTRMAGLHDARVTAGGRVPSRRP